MPIMLVVYLSVAAGMDFMWRKVKNEWIIYGLISAIVVSYIDSGLFGDGGLQLGMNYPGLILSLLGVVIPTPLLILFYLRFLGAGDIKLLMVIGCFIGAKLLIKLIPIMLISAGFLAVFLLLINYKTFLKQTHRMPMAPVMFISVLIFLFRYGYFN